MAAVGSGRGFLRVVSAEGVAEREEAENMQRNTAVNATDEAPSNLLAYVRREWQNVRNWRSAEAINDRLLHALRTFNGEYSASKLADIKKFGGSEIYARLIAVKCRGASSLLRDVYLGSDRPWALEPTPDATVPEDVTGKVMDLVQSEVQTLRMAGQPVDDAMVQQRMRSLMLAAEEAAQATAKKSAGLATIKLDDILVEGGFYNALAEFLVDLPLFPYAVMKGPVVKVTPEVKWEDGKAVVKNTPKLYWQRVSPFDFYWSAGVSNIADGPVFEKLRLSRSDLNELLGLPGFDDEAIRAALNDYAHGVREWWDETDSERADLESREDPYVNTSDMIDCLEFHGPVFGRWLKEQGFEDIEDEDRDYYTQVWIVGGRHIIKTQISPSPRQQPPYFVTSFEKVPGTVIGNGLPDILSDIEEVANATLRALVNNLSISSGPQVVVNTDRMSPSEVAYDLYPWKRWQTLSDPMGGSAQPVTFFQPDSNSAELLGVYEKFTMIADEISAIPRYLTGSERLGGAGRTASGLAMLMGNASKLLQTVASNVDRDVMEPLLQHLYDMVMLTAPAGLLRGDESIYVQGVNVAVQKETERMRQLELLQLTANPADLQIMGVEGRAKLLRSVADTVGLSGHELVPSDEKLAAAQAQQQGQVDPQAAAQAQGGQEALDQQNAPLDNLSQTRNMQPGG